MHALPATGSRPEPEKIINVNDVLDELIQQSVALVGKAGGPDEQGRQDPGHPAS
ncbi:MAG: hypothetical protein ACLUS6_00585 [Dysosmobacter sp.]